MSASTKSAQAAIGRGGRAFSRCTQLVTERVGRCSSVDPAQRSLGIPGGREAPAAVPTPACWTPGEGLLARGPAEGRGLSADGISPCRNVGRPIPMSASLRPERAWSQRSCTSPTRTPAPGPATVASYADERRNRPVLERRRQLRPSTTSNYWGAQSPLQTHVDGAAPGGKRVIDLPFACRRRAGVGCSCLMIRLPPSPEARHTRGLGWSRQSGGLSLCRA